MMNSRPTRVYARAVQRLFVAGFALLVGAAANSSPELTGVWKTRFVSASDPNWRIVDLTCSFDCSRAEYNYLEALLHDPANDNRPLIELSEQAQKYSLDHLADVLTPEAKLQQENYNPAEHPALDCSPDGDGLHHQIIAPVPFQIEQRPDKVIIRYEYWNAVRTVYTDGRGHPSDAEQSRLGHSIGRYEGSDLVVETVNMIPVSVDLIGGHVTASQDAIFIERYTPSDDGNRLDLEWTIVDPVNFREPYSGVRSYLLAPDWELDEFVCEAITGEF